MLRVISLPHFNLRWARLYLPKQRKRYVCSRIYPYIPVSITHCKRALLLLASFSKNTCICRKFDWIEFVSRHAVPCNKQSRSDHKLSDEKYRISRILASRTNLCNYVFRMSTISYLPTNSLHSRFCLQAFKICLLLCSQVCHRPPGNINVISTFALTKPAASSNPVGAETAELFSLLLKYTLLRHHQAI